MTNLLEETKLMTNLLEETKAKLERYGKSPEDVDWVGSRDYGHFTWEKFTELADFEYDAGYGTQKIAQDLIVVAGDIWMARTEYDGSEGWCVHTPPSKPQEEINPDSLGGSEIMWETLEEINSGDEE